MPLTFRVASAWAARASSFWKPTTARHRAHETESRDLGWRTASAPAEKLTHVCTTVDERPFRAPYVRYNQRSFSPGGRSSSSDGIFPTVTPDTSLPLQFRQQ